MRAHEFIIEREVKPYEFSELDLDVDGAYKILHKYCSESLSLINNPIWRGMKNHKD